MVRKFWMIRQRLWRKRLSQSKFSLISSSPFRRAKMIAAVDAHGAGFAGETAGFRAGFAFLEERGVGVVEIFQFHARDRLADETFDGENMRGVLGDHDGERVAGGLGAARPPDAMDVILGMLRH